MDNTRQSENLDIKYVYLLDSIQNDFPKKDTPSLEWDVTDFDNTFNFNSINFCSTFTEEPRYN